MRILPDSHALLWWLQGSPRLGPRARDLIDDDGNPLLYSAVTIWEIRIKQALGKLEHFESHDVLDDTTIVRLPITHAHAEAAAALPLHHRDPFDRMLIAQAQAEDAVILTKDDAFAAYDVRTAW